MRAANGALLLCRMAPGRLTPPSRTPAHCRSHDDLPPRMSLFHRYIRGGPGRRTPSPGSVQLSICCTGIGVDLHILRAGSAALRPMRRFRSHASPSAGSLSFAVSGSAGGRLHRRRNGPGQRRRPDDARGNGRIRGARRTGPQRGGPSARHRSGYPHRRRAASSSPGWNPTGRTSSMRTWAS